MFSPKTLLLFALALLSLCTTARADNDALKDVMVGMEGLKEAGSNPALLAQLLEDMRNPEMMAAAKEMMENPAYIKEMKKLQKSKEYKESMKKVQDMLDDPNTGAQAEAKFEHMLKVGQEQRKDGAASAMEEAMAAMGNPEVMAEYT